jgi:hypothetical protein
MDNKEIRVLFILKYREIYDVDCGHERSYKKLCSGLANSARFVHDMLAAEHTDTKMVEVIDNNDIDREVTDYRPTHVVIEAFWVVPEKFEVLQMLHPHVKWIIRSHSEIPFLAQEGPAMEWLTRYVQYEHVFIASNSEYTVRDFRTIIATANPDWCAEEVERKVLYLPNYYPVHKLKHHHKKKSSDVIDIGCFGAIRPLKNQLIQAIAALEYATIMGKYLRFHINADRPEQGGQACLKNLESLFATSPNAELVEHSWMSHEKFLELLSQMDMSLCVSLTETFCIIAADSVVSRVSVIGSPEIEFLSSRAQAQPTDSEDIVVKMLQANDWRFRFVLKMLNLLKLKGFSKLTRKIWLAFLS